MPSKHLYKGRAKSSQKRKFMSKYGKRGSYIYGAVVGKVKRERKRKYGHKR